MRGIECHHRRTRFREFVRLVYPNTIAGLIAWPLMKLGVIRWPPQIMRWPESLWDAIVEIDQFPETLRARMETISAPLAGLGFAEPLIEVEKSKGPDGREIVGTCLRARHLSGNFILQSLCSFHPAGIVGQEDQLISFFDNDQIWGTSNGRRKFDPPPGVSGKHHPQMTVEQLVIQHENYLSSLPSTPIPIRDDESMIRHVEEFRDRFFRHMIERGVFREIEIED